jgi:predicted HicB family RNase H-like nuclease
MNTMNYKGYIAHIEYDDRDNIFVGRLIGLPETVRVSFHADNVPELRSAFEESVDDYPKPAQKSTNRPKNPPAANSCCAFRPRSMARRWSLLRRLEPV